MKIIKFLTQNSRCLCWNELGMMLSIAQLKLCMLALRLDRDTSETKLTSKTPQDHKNRMPPKASQTSHTSPRFANHAHRACRARLENLDNSQTWGTSKDIAKLANVKTSQTWRVPQTYSASNPWTDGAHNRGEPWTNGATRILNQNTSNLKPLDAWGKPWTNG